MTHVFNADPVSRADKVHAFEVLVRFAAASKQLDLLAPFIAGAASWQRDWQLSTAEARALFLLLTTTYAGVGEATAAQGFRIRYLQTFEGPEVAPAELAGALEHAREAALGYIRAPALSQRAALAHLAAVSIPR